MERGKKREDRKRGMGEIMEGGRKKGIAGNTEEEWKMSGITGGKVRIKKGEQEKEKRKREVRAG